MESLHIVCTAASGKNNLGDNGILDERPDVCHFLPVFMTKAATNPTLVQAVRLSCDLKNSHSRAVRLPCTLPNLYHGAVRLPWTLRNSQSGAFMLS